MKKVLLLLSGGFDSAVAATILKEKFSVSAVYFSQRPFTDEEVDERVAKIAEHLKIQLTTLPAAHAFEELAAANQRLYFVLTKRFMLRAAEQLAKKKGIDFLATGENLGQVSSQTLSNLSVISRAVSLPILRPLLCWDKVETIDEARRLGLFDLCKGPECCTLLGPRHPATTSTEEEVLDEERGLDYEKLLDVTLAQAVA